MIQPLKRQSFVNGNTFTESIIYTFELRDHNQNLSCQMGDYLIDRLNLNASGQSTERTSFISIACKNFIFLFFYLSTKLFLVYYAAPPQPRDPILLLDLQIGYPVEVLVDFNAIPRPTNVYWRLSNGTQLQVEPPLTPLSDQQYFKVFQLKALVNIFKCIV